MFVNETLKNHLQTSATVSLRSLVIAEWNMNLPDNIFLLGNYRYRPTDNSSIYNTLPIIFDRLDTGNYYTGATDADVVVDGGFTDSNTPQQFTLNKEKMKMLYSLEDCIKPFRPRSGVNKPLYFSGRFLANSGANLASRPRYYMPSRDDEFRYWTSYRTENNVERGIAKTILNGLFFIDDAVPFVVYKNRVPANRIVVKMQTNVGTVNLGPFTTPTGTIPDPLFGAANRTTPARWKIQYLRDNSWVDAYTVTESQTRADGSPIIGPDGYVEIEYGLIIPDAYKNIFVFAENLSSATLLPETSVVGYAYLVTANQNDIGTFYIYTGTGETGYETFTPTYGWALGSESVNNQTNFVTDFTSPEQFNDPVNGGIKYREFEYITGIRIVAETMNKFDSTFDLIEMSPRLVANISDMVTDYSVTKILSDIGITSMPVGDLMASTGNITIFDFDQSFNQNNTNSIIANYIRKNIKFVFYEIIENVDNFDYYIPIKTLYSESIPQSDNTGATISFSLRDFYFYLESMPAPRLLMTQTSLSMAISTMLDYIGFTNYTFRRLPTESDPIIPYFFVAPDQSVAEVLKQLAISTQSAIFFDEYNNLVVMSKNFLMPTLTERPTDMVMSGNNNQTDSGVIENQSSGLLPNIIAVSSQDTKIYNDGRINYTTRYIQRSYGTIRQASLVDREKTWIYKPSLLWEVSGDESTKTINEVASTQGSYVLGAMPLNSDLSAALPTVVNGVVTNNVLDLGENVYWLTRYDGYFYANGEIIRYDAAEFNITGTGNVWISSNQEYQRYFASLPFNGKIYPTGLVRIYSEPYYETIDGITRLQPGPVYQHGRGQFGTPVTTHTAGINSYWSNNSYVRGCDMESQYLFTTNSLEAVTIENVSSSADIFYVDQIAGIASGNTINIISGTGELSSAAQTIVLEVNTVLPTATITNISASSGTITFTANNSFTPGQKISITGVTPTAYNLSDVIVATATTSSFTVTNAATGTYVSGGVATAQVYSFTVSETPTVALDDATIGVFKIPNTVVAAAGVNNTLARQTTRNGIIKNFMATTYFTETDVNSFQSTRTGTMQSSALVMNGPSFRTTENPIDFVSYVYKNLDNAYKHFGTRMRIIGKVENNENRSQTAIGSIPYYQISNPQPDLSINISGGSGGLAVLLNPSTNNGYYFEIVALSEAELDAYAASNDSSQDIHNVVFYKIMKNADDNTAVPVKLWGGITSINVDDGKFTGQYRMVSEDVSTVYDLAVEYQDIGGTRRFYLYINNTLIQVVDDVNPLPIYNNMALFVRGSSRCMYENIYALAENYSQNTVFTVGETLSNVFGDKQIDANESFRKYAVSGIIQGTYLSGLSAQQPPRYNMYYDEFGTIMREADYFNIKYDRSYPALYAQIAPTLNRIKGYSISGFQADSYGAEFLIFNATDKALVLDDTSGNYLRIQGITFTQDTTYELTVDDYFKKNSNLSDPPLSGSRLIFSPLVEKAKYNEIKLSRINYGKNDFTIDSPYIQTQDDANNLMGWIINKVMKPRRSVGMNIFAIPTLQLGDIVTVDYKNNDGLDIVAPNTARFVVYNIEYSRTENGPNMNVYLSEV